MTWEAIGAIGEVVGAAAVVVSIVYLSQQVRSNTRAVRARASCDATHSWATVNEGIVTSMEELWHVRREWARALVSLPEGQGWWEEEKAQAIYGPQFVREVSGDSEVDLTLPAPLFRERLIRANDSPERGAWMARINWGQAASEAVLILIGSFSLLLPMRGGRSAPNVAGSASISRPWSSSSTRCGPMSATSSSMPTGRPLPDAFSSRSRRTGAPR